MARARFDRLSPEKREQILRAAGQQFAEHGYDGATMQLILGKAGISAGAAYYYFDNKADLFAAAVAYYVDQLLRPTMDAAPIRDRDTFWTSFLGSIEIALSQKYDDHKVAAALRRAWMMSRELRARTEIGQEFARNETFLRNLLDLGRKVGAVRTDLPADLLFRCVLALNDAFDDWTEELPPETATADVRHAIAAFRQFLEPAEATEELRAHEAGET